eukprot:7383179-Prymnesium_polylepis.2
MNPRWLSDRISSQTPSTCNWNTLEFDSDKTNHFNGKELKAEELVGVYIEKGKQVVKSLNKRKASKDPWDKFTRSGCKRMHPDVWFDLCKKQKIDAQVLVVFIDNTTGVCRGWQDVLTNQDDIGGRGGYFPPLMRHSL